MSNSEPQEIDKNIQSTRQKLDAISPSFCSAKWLQVTMHLQNGKTHSCHHPSPHHVPLIELNHNKTALHNTEVKKKLRKEMLQGQKPKECHYCWNMEKLGSHIVSDRHIKSNDEWALPSLEQVANLPWDSNVNPTYVEVSFSNTCNFKCAYCFPHISSKWMSEIKEYGPYPTYHRHNSLKFLERSKLLPMPSEEGNPYLESFWQWWPELYPTLKVFRITGGEPLLSPNTFKVLDYIIAHPNRSLDLAVNSNLGVPTELVRKFSNKLKSILDHKAVRQAHVYTSVDTWGRQAEFIRHGLDLELFKRNLDVHFEINKDVPVTIMCAFNIMSIFNFHELIDFVADQRSQGRPLILDISYVHNPTFLDCRLLPDHWKKKAEFLLKQMESKNFFRYEIIKMSRLVEFINSTLPMKDLQHRRREFITFMDEHDRRRKTDFHAVFPEFSEDYKAWARIKPTRNLKYYFYKLLLG